MMKTALLCTILPLACALVGCARYAHGSARVALGMTPAEVQRACGTPYSRASDSSSEHWFYHDTAWDDSEKTLPQTSHFTDVTFIGGRVASFGPAAEARRTSSRPVAKTPAASPRPRARRVNTSDAYLK
jgi:hypothetical protein